MSRWTLIKNWIWNRTVRYWYLWRNRYDYDSKWIEFRYGRRIDTKIEYLKWIETIKVLTTVTTRHYIRKDITSD